MKRTLESLDDHFIDDDFFVRVQFDKADNFLKIIAALKELVPGGITFQFDENGISLQEMDSSHIAIVAISIPGNGLSSYICNKPQVVSIDIEKSWAFFKSVDKDAVIILSVSTSDFLSVEIRSKSMFPLLIVTI